MRALGLPLVLVAVSDLSIVACSGGGGKAAGPPGSSFDAAIAVTVGSAAVSPPAIPGTLASTADRRYYRGTFTHGVRYVAFTLTNAATRTDGSVVDTVVTVWDSAHRQIAQSDDAWPRFDTDSQVWFEVPADGVYYLTVEDCHSALPAGACLTAPVTDLAYSLYVAQVGTWYETSAAPTNDGVLPHDQPLQYWVPSGQPAGHYAASILDGNFPAVATAHVFSFTPPLDTYVSPGARARADFFVQSIGAHDGDGSTASLWVWVMDASDTNVLARADLRNYRNGDDPTSGPLLLSVPVTLGQKYYLFVEGTEASSNPATDYYFIQTEVGSFYVGQKETEAATGTGANDSPATAQRLGAIAGRPGLFAVDGNLATTSDVDWFELDPPPGTASAGLSCTAARTGSGLVGLTASLYDASGATTTLLGTFGPESVTSDLVTFFDAPGTARSFLKVTATGQDGLIRGTDYRCFVTFSPAAGATTLFFDDFSSFPSSAWNLPGGSPSKDASHGNPAPSVLLGTTIASIQTTEFFPTSGGKFSFYFDVATDLSAITNGQYVAVHAVVPGLVPTGPLFTLSVSDTGSGATAAVGCDYSPTYPVTADSGWHRVAVHVDWAAGTYACTWDGAAIGGGTHLSTSSPQPEISIYGSGIPVRVDNVTVIEGE